MAMCGTPTRRVLIGRVGSAIGVFGTFLLPWRVAAAASAPGRADRRGLGRADAGRMPLVMLDPGHGGKDSGAIGVSGTYEKHISLAAGLELKRLLEAEGRYQVALTRTRDVFIPLEHRVEISESHGAALFVSMHADALPPPYREVRGASVYTLSSTASDPESAALAARENSADRFLGPAYRAVTPQIARILSSLVQRETRVDSARLAQQMVGSLKQDVLMLTNPDRHAGFVVLQSADIPSILVEMGFMSNPQDESFLRRPAYRFRVASAMKQAIDAYFAATHGREMAG
jgi:N-acetylmuramoyl-L-alanine amidase